MRAEAKGGTAGRSAPKRIENAGASPRKSKSESEQAEPRRQSADSFPIVGVGASAGGLEAFSHLLRNVPPDTGMAFVIIQHLDPTHHSMLAEILSRDTRMRVGEAASGMRVEPDHVYVIPPNRMMQLDDGHLRLAPRGEANERHMPVDHFFRSLANNLKTRAIGVVLSGTATDGALGIEAIKAEGGITFAQEENSARHNGMPRAAISTGCVDFVLSPENIARELAVDSQHVVPTG